MKVPLIPLQLYTAFSLFIFANVQTLKIFQISAPNWVFSYVNDFLVIPIVCTIVLNFIWWIKPSKAIRLNGFTILSLVLFYSVYFEYYLPQKSEKYIADFWDIVCYSLGGMMVYIIQKLE